MDDLATSAHVGQNSVEIHPSENQMKNALLYTGIPEGMGDLVINAHVQR